MKKTIKSALCLMMLAVSSASFADVASSVYVSPYIGVDMQIRDMEFKKGFGDNLFNKNFAQATPFIGLLICDFLGVEFGYEQAFRKHTTSVQARGMITLGKIISQDETSVNSVKIYGPHVDLIGHLPLSKDRCTSIFGLVGVASLTAKITYQPIIIRGIPVPPPILPDIKDIFSKRKTILRAGLGIQQMLHACAGVRATLIWENTSKFKNLRSISIPDSLSKAYLKDSVILGIGVFLKF